MASSLLTLATFTSLLSFVASTPLNEGRIVGGLLAPDHSFPYLVGLSITKRTEDGIYWCGGSLISPNVILTAAHCVHGEVIEVEVKLGVHKRRAFVPKEHLIDVQSQDIQVHQKFNPNTTEYDIALIHLPVNVTLTDDVQLINLASPYMDEDFLQGQDVIAAGWGKVVDNMTGISEVLRYVDVKIINQKKCEEIFDSGVVTSKNICIDGTDLKGTCNGDSGGPLVYEAADDSRYLVGVTSFGSKHGCDKGYPTVFTRTTSFLDWIAERTGLVVS